MDIHFPQIGPGVYIPNTWIYKMAAMNPLIIIFGKNMLGGRRCPQNVPIFIILGPPYSQIPIIVPCGYRGLPRTPETRAPPAWDPNEVNYENLGSGDHFKTKKIKKYAWV